MKNYFYLMLVLLFFNSCFTPRNYIPKVDSNPSDYIKLEEKVSTQPRYLSNDKLYIIYQEDYNDQDGKLDYKIYNQKQVVVQSNSTQTIPVNYGVNKLIIPLNNTVFTGIFILEVTNEKGVKKYLTFIKGA